MVTPDQILTGPISHLWAYQFGSWPPFQFGPSVLLYNATKARESAGRTDWELIDVIVPVRMEATKTSTLLKVLILFMGNGFGFAEY
jgi:hypothetical protein